MSDWAHALSMGVAGAAKTGADIIDKQMAQTAQAEADQRAADRKLDTASRLMAIQESMQNRAAERFSGVVKTKMGEAVPVEAAAVADTGITREAAGEIGWQNGGVKADGAELSALIQKARDTIASPNTTPEQKADAQTMMELLNEQMGGQKAINEKAVAGTTRKRTLDEATDAAREDTLMNDAPAYMAGTGMLASAGKSKAEQAKLDSRAEIERNKISSREVLEREKIAQREADSVRDNDASMARVKAIADRAAAVGKGGNKSAMIQNIEYMTNVLKYSPEQVEAYVFDKKGISEKELAANILSKDKYGEMTAADAAARARELTAAFAPAQAAKPATGAPSAGPKRLKWNPSTGKLE